jgi:hypothetical protein
MNVKYIEGSRAIVERNGYIYRRFSADHWQEKIHTGDFHNLYGEILPGALEREYQALTRTVYTIPDTNSKDRRAVLELAASQGFEWVVRYQFRYELFKNEEDQQARVRELVQANKSCPLNGKLRVGNGDNLHWFI